MTQAQLVPFRDACGRLGIAVQTGYNKVYAGVFPVPVRKIGRTSFVLQSQLEKFITAQERVHERAQARLLKAQPAAKRGRRRLRAD